MTEVDINNDYKKQMLEEPSNDIFTAWFITGMKDISEMPDPYLKQAWELKMFEILRGRLK